MLAVKCAVLRGIDERVDEDDADVLHDHEDNEVQNPVETSLAFEVDEGVKRAQQQ